MHAETMPLIPHLFDITRIMYFVDGENLAIRTAAIMKESKRGLAAGVTHKAGVLVWSAALAPPIAGIIRKHYYTSVPNDGVAVSDAEDLLIAAGIEAPRVFPKHKSKGSKRVDIALATDMLAHSMRRHLDIAILIAGDEDYVPLVQAVQSEGVQVHVWFVANGLNPALRKAGDRFLDITDYLLEKHS